MTTATVASHQAVYVRIGRLVWALILPVGLIAGYQVWSQSAQNPYFPTIPEMLAAFWTTWTGNGFTRHILPSLANLARGYLLGVTLGVLAGVALGRIPALRRATSPLIAFILTIPAVATLPLFLIVFGVGPQLQIGVICFSVFFYVLVTTADAIRGIEPILIDLASIYRISRWRRLLFILLPAAVPQILSAARVTLSLGVLVMVVSEMVGASRGIGAVTLLAQQSFAYDQMWAGMILLAILGVGLNALFSLGERWILVRVGYQDTPQKEAP